VGDALVIGREERYREIDLFRAIAILMVIGFHYLSRWTPPQFDVNLYPYGDFFAENVVFRHGHLGVDFFFIISGFVIALTLESCHNFADFLRRRAARLLPAMIICSLLTLIIVSLFVPVSKFQEEAQVWNLLPSWTFTSPYIWSKVLPVTSHVDGAYWSLVIEVKFYVWAACIYFLNKVKFSRNMFLFCAAASVAYVIGQTFRIKPLQQLEFYVLFGRYAMLFSAGIFFYQIHKCPTDFGKLSPFLIACFALELGLTALVPQQQTPFAVVATFKFAFFLAFYAVSIGMLAPKNAIVDFIIRIGLASYPLYLLHQNIGVGLISRSIGVQNPVVIFAVFVGVCAAIIYVSFCVHLLVEQPGKRLILSLLRTQPQASERLRGGA
jgi:peptidoglycan/LPS O-acetylase OafA/YrhL